MIGHFNEGEMLALGFSDGITFKRVSDIDGSEGTNWDPIFLLGNDTSNYQAISTVSMTSDGFDVTWLKSADPGGSIVVFYLAFR